MRRKCVTRWRFGAVAPQRHNASCNGVCNFLAAYIKNSRARVGVGSATLISDGTSAPLQHIEGRLRYRCGEVCLMQHRQKPVRRATDNERSLSHRRQTQMPIAAIQPTCTKTTPGAEWPRQPPQCPANRQHDLRASGVPFHRQCDQKNRHKHPYCRSTAMALSATVCEAKRTA